MSTSTFVCERRKAHPLLRARDYLELTKPRIALMELVTIVVAALVARAGHVDVRELFHAIVGTALVAGSASALNQWLEWESDGLMERTADRPLPAGRLSGREVVWFGALAAIVGVAWLVIFVNPLTAALGLMTWVLYVWIYTPLKSQSPFNTVVGAVAGAGPVLIGWAAVGGRWGLAAATLFMIVFLWQFPHFMAIAWMYRADYARAGLQMLPVVDPTGRRAGRQAVVAALSLIPISLLPAVLQFAGMTYLLWALVLGLGHLAFAARFCRRLDDTSARALLRASLVYLPALLAGLTVGPLV